MNTPTVFCRSLFVPPCMVLGLSESFGSLTARHLRWSLYCVPLVRLEVGGVVLMGCIATFTSSYRWKLLWVYSVPIHNTARSSSFSLQAPGPNFYFDEVMWPMGLQCPQGLLASIPKSPRHLFVMGPCILSVTCYATVSSSTNREGCSRYVTLLWQKFVWQGPSLFEAW